MKPRVNLVTLGVADVPAARTFYQRLGFQASPAGNDEVAFFDANGVVLALFGHDALAEDAGMDIHPAPSFRGASLAWNVGTEGEVDAVMAHAVSCGARLTKAPHRMSWGGYAGYFSDPDGHLWEVAFNPFFPLSPQGQVQLP